MSHAFRLVVFLCFCTLLLAQDQSPATTPQTPAATINSPKGFVLETWGTRAWWASNEVEW